MTQLKILAVGAALAIASIGAFAQATPRVDAHEKKQQTRIDAGVASGELNARETNRLDKQQGHVATVEAKAKADGTVTAAERKRLAKAQHRTSENIYQQKHDAQTAPGAAKP
jgi:hypothetical protein